MNAHLSRQVAKQRDAMRAEGLVTKDWPQGSFAQHAGESITLLRLSGDREQIREELLRLLALTQTALESHDTKT